VETIRSRLTVWYATALALTLAVFAAVIYLARRGASYQDLDQRLQSEADLTAGILGESYRARGDLVELDSAGKPVLISDVAALLEVVPDFLVITHADSEGRVLFASHDARALTFNEFEQLRRLAQPPIAGRAGGTVVLVPSNQGIRWLARPLTGAGPQFGGILAGADTRRAELAPSDLLSVMLLVLPLALVATVLVGSWIARRALEPVTAIITEVREITDGRTLHRRLPVPMVKDELGRLSETLNEMMARLERSFAALRRFTADASHELKTPLTVLRAGVERALTTPGLPRETLASLEEALQEVNRMTELVDALLTLARADEGRAPLHREPVDLRTIVQEVQETGELLAEDAGVTMNASTPEHPVVVPVDHSRIRQLILNLLTNAVKYTPRGGSVSLELAQDDGRIVIAVTDTGVGIAAGDLPHIFDRFWRADTARTRTGERPGAGLGLAICKWIAEAHGGSIEVHSRPGRGSRFTVTLPKTAE
jgi:heavy metal sensor kinase